MSDEAMHEQEGDDGRRADGDGDSRDEDREAILARRKRMVAAALSSIALGAAAVDCAPTACLSPRPPEDAQSDSGTMAEAQACLTAPLDRMDVDASEAGPSPCLDVAPMDGGGGD
ncbi:MAG: hypothetical protein JNK05_02960 [Myxococcales bacterium]|nr:hypothetical protein [Myxococcales bacterium]